MRLPRLDSTQRPNWDGTGETDSTRLHSIGLDRSAFRLQSTLRDGQGKAAHRTVLIVKVYELLPPIEVNLKLNKLQPS
jgi:hypothetical protein